MAAWPSGSPPMGAGAVLAVHKRRERPPDALPPDSGRRAVQEGGLSPRVVPCPTARSAVSPPPTVSGHPGPPGTCSRLRAFCEEAAQPPSLGATGVRAVARVGAATGERGAADR